MKQDRLRKSCNFILRRLRWQQHEFEIILGYIVRPHSEKEVLTTEGEKNGQRIQSGIYKISGTNEQTHISPS